LYELVESFLIARLVSLELLVLKLLPRFRGLATLLRIFGFVDDLQVLHEVPRDLLVLLDDKTLDLREDVLYFIPVCVV